MKKRRRKLKDSQTFERLNEISKTQSRHCNENCRRIFYVLFATAWGNLFNKNTSNSILMVFVILTGIIYITLQLGRYLYVTHKVRGLLYKLNKKRINGNIAIENNNKTSKNAYRIMLIEILCIFIMAILLALYYIKSLSVTIKVVYNGLE